MENFRILLTILALALALPAGAQETSRDPISWPPERLGEWKGMLSEAEKECAGDRERLSLEQVKVIEDICRTVKEDFHSDGRTCIYLTEVSWTIFNYLEIPAEPVHLLEPVKPLTMPLNETHVVCMVKLANGKMMFADPIGIKPMGFVSQPFDLEKEFREDGIYRKLRDEDNPPGPFSRFRILGMRELAALSFSRQAWKYIMSGELDKAFPCAERAIELDPNCAQAYNNLGVAYHRMADILLEQGNNFNALCYLHGAITTISKSCQTDPNFILAHQNLKIVQLSLGQRAVSCFWKAVAILDEAIGC